jgi:SET domain-containing protein
MYARLFVVKETGNKGKGLFANQLISKGTIVGFQCERCEVLSGIDPERMTQEERDALFLRAYRKEDGSFVAPCDESRYINHACDASILDSGQGFDIVVRDIREGEEATFDYRCFYDDLNMPCHCGSDDCCRLVTCVHPIPDEIARFWAKRVDAALKQVVEVPQPLKEALRRRGIASPLSRA